MKKTITKQYGLDQVLRIKFSSDGTDEHNQYFSTTADLFVNEKREMGCCLHDKILEVMPEAAPFVALHLAKLDGVPMHAVENGFYWLAKVAGIQQPYEPEQDEKTCLQYLAKHLRVSEEKAAEFVEVVKSIYASEVKYWAPMGSENKGAKLKGFLRAKEFFSKAIVDSQRERWQNEANAALAWLESL